MIPENLDNRYWGSADETNSPLSHIWVLYNGFPKKESIFFVYYKPAIQIVTVPTTLKLIPNTLLFADRAFAFYEMHMLLDFSFVSHIAGMIENLSFHPVRKILLFDIMIGEIVGILIPPAMT